MEEKIYAIWLQQALKYNNYCNHKILEFYEKIEDFYKDNKNNWRLLGCFNNSQIDALKNTPLELAYKIFKRCEMLGYKVLEITNKDYPKLLIEIPDPPAVLYTQGNLSCLKNEIPIAIVGTREPTIYGITMSKDMSTKISFQGGIVVSGGALGIDSEAHKGAIKYKKPTICVLGCGINYRYLISNDFLREKISQYGLLISEYPPDYPAHPYNFPKRNRIISGLSLATIVIEAGQKSGSLITANLANEQNRDVLVVPVDMASPYSKGIISLINDGARVITDIQILIDNYKNKFNHNNLNINSALKKIEKHNHLNEISKEANIIYELIGNNGSLDVDKICETSKLDIKCVLASLTELEIYGLIKNVKGREYQKIDI